jgi:hypothetical protein
VWRFWADLWLLDLDKARLWDETYAAYLEAIADLAGVDKRAAPGGHWNDAYSFVGLHQPSAFYGVSSMPLGSGQIDSHGANAGMFELAPGPEVSGYFDAVVRRRLLPSGRVRYLPMTDYRGDGRVVSLLTGAETRIDVRRRTVDATFFGTSVPSTHTPKFTIADGVRLVPPNALPDLWKWPGPLPRHFTIIGAGKTAMDTICWLLAAGAEADAIRWIVPRDSWLLNRRSTQPGDQFFFDSIGGQLAQFKAAAEALDAKDFFERMEAAGVMLRIDPKVDPEMYHYATISEAEVAQLRQVRDVVRHGRVIAIEPDRMVLEKAELAVPQGTLFVDCSAIAVTARPIEPVFQDGRIILQAVRMPLVVFSAALIAWVEANVEGDAERNALCRTFAFPDRIAEFPAAFLGNMINQGAWNANKALSRWIHDCRLDGFARVVSGAAASGDAEKLALLGRLKESVMPCVMGLQRLSAMA